MKLSLPILSKKENLSYFLVLVLRHNKASAVIFEESGGTVRIINQASQSFTDSIETAPDEELLSVLDKTISKAESVLPANIETQKTIFGLKENWIEESKIKKQYLGKLKKISDELGLIPIGFLITTEAIAHFLAKEEGAPVSAILAEIDKNYVSVSLIRAGKIIETKNSALEGSTTETVDTLLKHFETAEVLPSRVIIFDGEKDLSQEFIGHQWSKTLPFLHLPQISNLEKGFDAKAVLSGAASEMGFQVLGDATPRVTQRTMPSDMKEEAPLTREEDDEPPTTQSKSEEISENLDESFGFVKDKDIAKNIPKESTPEETNFNTVPVAVEEAVEEIPEELQMEEIESKPLASSAGAILLGGKKVFSRISTVAKRSISKLPVSTSLFKSGNKIVYIGAALLLLLLTFGFYLFGRSATITLALEGKKVSAQKDVTFIAGQPTDASKNIISAQFVDVTENGSTTTNATGKKDIGTPAKGKVTIFNNSDLKRTLAAGTAITSSNNLKYKLDSSITVASQSASGDDFSTKTITPGKIDVNVTASDIGPTYNLPSNTKFTLDDPTIVAKNDNAFSGGTKKTITVVSEDDISKLESDLVKNLEGKAKDDVTKKISGEKILLPVFVSEGLDKKTFDKKEGEEATKVTLKADVNYKSITYNKSDLVDFAKTILQIQDSLILDESRITTIVKNVKVKNTSEASTTLEISGFLLPKIDNAVLAQKISGKNIAEAQDILTKIPQVSSATIKISPNIPLLPKTIPSAGKIKFVTNSNE